MAKISKTAPPPLGDKNRKDDSIRESRNPPIENLFPTSVKSIRIDFTNANGVVLSKAVSSDFSSESLKNGVKMFRGNYFMMLSYSIAPNSRYTGESGDISIIADQSTLSVLPYDGSTARAIGDLYEPETRQPWQCCARNLMKNVLGDAREMGFECISAGELEFYLLKEKNLASPLRTRSKTRKKKATIEPFPSKSIPFTSYALDMSEAVLKDIVANLTGMGIRVTRFAKEGGAGQFEINLLHQKGIKTPDDIMTFKQVVKATALRRGLIASFMPKPFQNDMGSGMHVHMSLSNLKTGENAFVGATPSGRKDLSETCLHFVGGILHHSSALCALTAPTFNSYKRLKPGTVSADSISFGLDNRSAAIRVPSERTSSGLESTRVEFRIPDCTCNPHLALSAILASGLDGIAKKLSPGTPIGEDRGEASKQITSDLPRSLDEALDRLREDRAFFRKLLGDEFYDEFLIMKEYEWSRASSVISDWELESYVQAF